MRITRKHYHQQEKRHLKKEGVINCINVTKNLGKIRTESWLFDGKTKSLVTLTEEFHK